MNSNKCPASCHDCSSSPVEHEIEHTIIVRGKPDRSMTYTKKGFLCREKSFFFSHSDNINAEEKIVNAFAAKAV